MKEMSGKIAGLLKKYSKDKYTNRSSNKLHKDLVIRGEFFPFVLVKDSNPKCTKLPALRN